MDESRPDAAEEQTSGGRSLVLWTHYVFRRGPEVEETWEQLFRSHPVRLLYVAGRGFDVRARLVMEKFVATLRNARSEIESAELLLMRFPYRLDPEMEGLTEENARALEEAFADFGRTEEVRVEPFAAGEDDLSFTNTLRLATKNVLERSTNRTHIILDISSLPRVAVVALSTGILQKLIPDRTAPTALYANGVDFQILVAEDAQLDGLIHAEEPANDLVLIPGFSGALRTESMRDWPLAWFPILGENRLKQLEKLMTEIPGDAEICPVLPHPSSDPRRADQLLIEYKKPLFDSRETPISNILLVHERNPFEAYRQLLRAMERYRESMGVLGGCRLVVTPLGSKLITVGASLACFEMRPAGSGENYAVAIPYATPTRYVAPVARLRATEPVIASLLLTGRAYE